MSEGMTFLCRSLYVSATQAKGAPGQSCATSCTRSASTCTVLAEARPAIQYRLQGCTMAMSCAIQLA